MRESVSDDERISAECKFFSYPFGFYAFIWYNFAAMFLVPTVVRHCQTLFYNHFYNKDCKKNVLDSILYCTRSTKLVVVPVGISLVANL